MIKKGQYDISQSIYRQCKNSAVNSNRDGNVMESVRAICSTYLKFRRPLPCLGARSSSNGIHERCNGNIQ